MTPSQHYTTLGQKPQPRDSGDSDWGDCRVPHSPDSGTGVRKTSWECGGEVPSWKSHLGFLSQAGTKCLQLGVTPDSSAFPKDWGPRTMHMKGSPSWLCIRIAWSYYIYLGPTFTDSDSVGLGWCLGICIFKKLPQWSQCSPGCEITTLGCKCSLFLHKVSQSKRGPFPGVWVGDLTRIF